MDRKEKTADFLSAVFAFSWKIGARFLSFDCIHLRFGNLFVGNLLIFRQIRKGISVLL